MPPKRRFTEKCCKVVVLPKKMKQTAIVLYEVSQVRRFMQMRTSAAFGEPWEVVALGADVEFALEERAVPFYSARGLRSVTSVERIALGEELGKRICTDPTFSFFSYRDIHAGSLFTMDLQWYITLLTYYLDLYISIFEQRNISRVVTFSTGNVVLDTAGVVAPFEARVAVEALQYMCRQKNVPCDVMDEVPRKKLLERQLFAFKRRLFGRGMSVFNAVQSMRPRRKIRILASEYWKNVGPLMRELSEGELYLLDRTESLKAGFAAAWRHQMHFTAVEQYTSRRVRRSAADKAAFFVNEWARLEADNVPLGAASFRGVSLTPLLRKVLAHIVKEGGVRSVQTIDAVHAMFERVRPDIVLVRASASQQIHFAILCHVARSRGIPSLEIQHGVRYVGPGSFSKQHAAEYMAVYGPVVRTQMKTVGYTDKTLFDIGSPRFDAYPRTSEKHQGLTVTCVGPSLVPGFWEDTYDAMDYLTAMAAAVRGTGAAIIVKLRPGGVYADFYNALITRAFAGITYRICRQEPLSEIFAKSDIVISPYSTAMLEALLMYKPTIFFASLPAYAEYGGEFAAYAGDALVLARTQEELARGVAILAGDVREREELALRARQCVERNYLFDGNSSERLAEAVRTLTRAGTRDDDQH